MKVKETGYHINVIAAMWTKVEETVPSTVRVIYADWIEQLTMLYIYVVKDDWFTCKLAKGKYRAYVATDD